MKLRIAQDARPQVRTLLLATLLTFALWFIPYASILVYPFRLFVTFIHEGGHALATLLTGNTVKSLSVAMDTSGLVESHITQGGLFSQVFFLSAGYLGAILFGALLLMLVRRTVAARIVLIGSGVFVLALTLIYGLFVPLANFTLSPFTVIAGVAISAGLLAAAKYASPRTANFLVGFLAVQCVLNAVFDLKDVLFMAVASGAQTDAMSLALVTGIPAMFWALAWIGLGFVVLSAALRAYAVRRSPSQPDLPFEDPLEV